MRKLLASGKRWGATLLGVAFGLCTSPARSNYNDTEQILVGTNHYLVTKALRTFNIFERAGLIRYQVKYVLPVGTFVGQIETREYIRHVDADCTNAKRREYSVQDRTEDWRSVYDGTAQAAEVATACKLLGFATNIQPPPLPVAPPIVAEAPTRPVPKGATSEPAPAEGNRGDASRNVTFGSGFMVSTSMAITNAHVVQNCARIVARQGSELRAASVVASAQGVDLALLRLQAPLGQPTEIRQTATLGEDVMVSGHPLVGVLSSDIVVTIGVVNSLSGLRDEPTLFQLSAPVHSGNSGGPVLDRRGFVVGVVVSKLNALKFGQATGDIPQNINFAIKPEVLKLFLDTHRVSYRTSEGGKVLDNAELAKKARQATVQIACRD